MRNPLIVAIVTISLVALNAAGVQIDSNIQNKNVERTIDLTTQLVKIFHKITLENKATKEWSGVSYSFAVPKDIRDNLAYISIRDALKKELKATEEKTADGSLFTVSVTSSSPTPVLHVETVFSKSLEPYPTHITQNERQLVRYFDSAYSYSPYRTVTQKTTVQLASKSVESYTTVKPSAQVDGTITYGPYENVAPYSTEPITVHYENNSPFLTITNLERVIEVSHWGNIAVEETIDIVHSGAVLKGSFSRYDYQKDARSNQPSVKSYKTILPASATEVYYRDTNGNISTSAMRILKDSVELDLRPRFPLFGGWKTHYTIGYNVPSFEYLFSSGDQYVLKMRVIDHVYDDMVIEKATVKIILPEGTSNIKLIPPYPVTRLPDQVHYTYLDTVGRPVIVFTKQNLVENHIVDFNLKYNFSKVLMVQEPLLIIGFLYALFLIVIVWTRLDFSITKDNAATHHHKD
ncbi:dolichyl-diphosphooligosaccharide--protein glycosyltransferase subunit 1 [Sitodiplosis mosellana]|uniref:dolichyl-diphosphooligosaccharide--protein glycosyltransferase subunit 1 n=1 Tax=Sitodiplosis mosellana TaxID=263140 RepID=UPI0024445AA7|nr:dolichyl-diphosphooligosaccharide--protein glycosyltransferase subunit 1 [Sitodiplosis mosellana]